MSFLVRRTITLCLWSISLLSVLSRAARLRSIMSGPPGPPRGGPGGRAPPFRVDREKARLLHSARCTGERLHSRLCQRHAHAQTCPLLLRVFPKLGGHHRPEDFPFGEEGALPKEEFQVRLSGAPFPYPPRVLTPTAADLHLGGRHAGRAGRAGPGA